jgi:acyl carrier protein
MEFQEATLTDVTDMIVRTLGIENRSYALSADSPLFGGIPELDSFGVVELAMALEARFGIELDDGAFSAEVFETVGTLTAFVEGKRNEQRVALTVEA